ncbi:MAG: hypothetical protein PVH61_19735 [Candidatus Aminicenantes bacterium]|jgi:hypothetical protein
MEITPELKEMYDQLSPCNIKFLEYVQNHPAGFERSRFSRAFDWKDPTLEVTLQSWPLFISRKTRENIAGVCVKLFRLIQGLPARQFGNDPVRISEYYGIPREKAQICLYGVDDEYLGNFLARGDFIFTPTGPRCLEYNVSANLGGWELPLWEAQFLQVPFIAEFINTRKIKITNKNLIALLFDYILHITLKAFPDEEEINIALAIRKQDALKGLINMQAYFTRVYLDCLRRKHPLKGTVIFCRYDQLKVKDQDLYYEDKKIHTILDYYLGEIPLELVALFKMRKVLIYDGPAAVILSNKLNIALLSELENNSLLNNEEREIIKKYVPWTRKMVRGPGIYQGQTINLEDFILSHQQQLVLKPARGYGGEGVVIGNQTSANQWKEQVEKAFQEKYWVIQEHLHSPRLYFQWGEKGAVPCDTTWGILVFGTRYAGIFMRALPPRYSSGVVNVKQGAQVPIVFEVEE